MASSERRHAGCDDIDGDVGRAAAQIECEVEVVALPPEEQVANLRRRERERREGGLRGPREAQREGEEERGGERRGGEERVGVVFSLTYPPEIMTSTDDSAGDVLR